MQLSSSLARARLSLALKWRPREENVEADQLTNEVFTGFEEGSRINVEFGDVDLGVLLALVESRNDFVAAKLRAKEEAKHLPKSSKKNFDKSPW